MIKNKQVISLTINPGQILQNRLIQVDSTETIHLNNYHSNYANSHSRYHHDHSSLSLIHLNINVTYKPSLVIEKKLIVPIFPSE